MMVLMSGDMEVDCAATVQLLHSFQRFRMVLRVRPQAAEVRELGGVAAGGCMGTGHVRRY